jgi:peptidoglycan hydrolase-like protein with peptidoglycan-binding domain/TPR repeat protein
VHTRLGDERFARPVSSLTSWVTMAVTFVLAINPAAALGNAGTPHGGASVGAPTGGASQTRGTTHPATPNADPHHARDASAHRRTSDQDVLAVGSGYSNNSGSTMVTALQRRLSGLGYSPGPVDGRYGPLTEGAVIRFQSVQGLKVDGVAGPLTLAAVASARSVLYPGEGYPPGRSAMVRRLQRELAAAGYAPGPIDGRYGPLTERAVRRFQAAHHLHVDGIAGPQTAGQLETTLRARIHRQKRLVPPPAHRAQSHRRPVLARSQRVSRSPGSLSTAWIVLAACFVAAVLIAMLLRLRPRGGTGLPATKPRPSGRRAHARDVARAAGPGDGPPDLNVPSAGPPERAAQPPADDADGEAAFDRGLQLARDGDLVGAEAAFRLLDERGDGAAACNLGVLLEQRGDLAGARDAYRRADERGIAEGACNLGALLQDEGDLHGAEVAYRRADRRGDADGAANLGVLLQERGELTGAEAAYGRASERGHAAAASNLGLLLERRGERVGAEDAYRGADRRGDPSGSFNLGVLLEQRGDLAGARDAYQRADERGNAAGACNLGALLEREGDVARARDAYRRADGRGDPVGARSLGRLLADEGDRVGAKRAFERAERRGHPDAAFDLGVLLLQEGDRPGALEALQRAGERGSSEIADLANAAVLELSGREANR